jgi:uncharacterized protein YecE (DUF72 family)
VPHDFRFSVKVPRTITHERALADCGDPIAKLLDEMAGLGDKLGVLLVQLPPKLVFDSAIAETFFHQLTAASAARVVCEPRHASWFAAEADALLAGLRVARVAADPARVPAAAMPGGWRGFSYWRLHGSPVVYHSPYGAERLKSYGAQIAQAESAAPAWCIFDNTASFAALGDALALDDLLSNDGAQREADGFAPRVGP